jgi:glycosyltransferase involved in cell wall biosynthesis
MSETKLVSVVITTKNEEKNIGRCLDSVLEQSYSNIEIVLVDNSSTDRTIEIAKEKGVRVLTHGPERSAQRNYGMIENSKGEYILYVDADMLLTRHLISSCVEYLENRPNVVGLFISEEVLGRSLFSQIRRFERRFYDGTVIDACRFFRRGSFVETGGFDEDLFKFGSGEDWDLDKKIRRLGQVSLLPKNYSTEPVVKNDWLKDYALSNGVRIGSSNLILHDESLDRLLPYLQKKNYYASGFNGYISKWGKTDPDIKRQFGVAYRLFGIFMENGKWKRSLSRPDLYILTVFLKILVGMFTFRRWK